MNVTYTPPLVEQIKGNHAVADGIPVVVFILASQSFVMAVDPKTRQATSDKQQFLRHGDTIRILPRWQWVDQPQTLEVGEARF